MRTIHAFMKPSNTIRLRRPPLGWGEAPVALLLAGVALILAGLALGGLG